MTLTADDLYRAALSLPDAERADLAERLFDSVPAPSGRHPLWAEEIRRRSAEVAAGTAPLETWAAVKRAAWDAEVGG